MLFILRHWRSIPACNSLKRRFSQHAFETTSTMTRTERCSSPFCCGPIRAFSYLVVLVFASCDGSEEAPASAAVYE